MTSTIIDSTYTGTKPLTIHSTDDGFIDLASQLGYSFSDIENMEYLELGVSSSHKVSEEADLSTADKRHLDAETQNSWVEGSPETTYFNELIAEKGGISKLVSDYTAITQALENAGISVEDTLSNHYQKTCFVIVEDDAYFNILNIGQHDSIEDADKHIDKNFKTVTPTAILNSAQVNILLKDIESIISQGDESDAKNWYEESIKLDIPGSDHTATLTRNNMVSWSKTIKEKNQLKPHTFLPDKPF